MAYQSVVTGCGSYVPSKIMMNEEFAELVDTTDEWIIDRTGIKQRHIAAPDQLTSDLGCAAALDALKSAGKIASDVDVIVVATTTPDNIFPSTATKIQAKLGAHNAFALDIQAVCAGFIYALAVADNFLKTGQAKTALVIGCETMSRLIDWQDRATCVLFGDGAGAVLLERQENVGRGILSTRLYSDGRMYDSLYADGGASQSKHGTICMNGREIMKNAVEKLGAAIENALETHNLTIEDIDWFVPHQANIRIIKALAEKFSIPLEKVIINVEKYANTSAASIPLALTTAVSDGRLKPGHLIICEGIGGGLTWGSAVIRW